MTEKNENEGPSDDFYQKEILPILQSIFGRICLLGQAYREIDNSEDELLISLKLRDGTTLINGESIMVPTSLVEEIIRLRESDRK